MGKANLRDLAQAQHFFQRAFEIDPMFAPACTAMAMSFVYEGAAYASRPLIEAGRMADTWARRAVAIEPDDADAQASLAWSICLTGNMADALERLSLALSINPNSVWAHVVKGAALLFRSDRRSDARGAMLAALRLSPRDPLNAIPSMQIGISYYLERDYLNAFEKLKQVATRHPDFPLPYRFLAASLGQLSHFDEARAALRACIAVSPTSFDFYVRSRPPWFRPEDYEHMLEGLRKAGWDAQESAQRLADQSPSHPC
jgi:adenylate cyclase